MIIAENRQAHFHYILHDRFEAGLALLGTEVKALRQYRARLTQAYVVQRAGELFLHHWHIPAYAPAGPSAAHAPMRERKILLHRRQINVIMGAITRKGMTAVPTKVYLSKRGWIKIELALATGKKSRDKRETIKQREWDREKHRILKGAQE